MGAVARCQKHGFIFIFGGGVRRSAQNSSSKSLDSRNSSNDTAAPTPDVILAAAAERRQQKDAALERADLKRVSVPLDRFRQAAQDVTLARRACCRMPVKAVSSALSVCRAWG
jgi:hypothetical protein